MKPIRWILPWIIACLPVTAGSTSAALQDLRLKPFTAEYDLSWGILVFAKVQVSLTLHSPNRYRYEARTTPTGLYNLIRSDEITEISKGMLKGGRITPLNYHYRHKKTDSDHQVDLEFNWQALQVINQTPDSRWIMKVNPGTQDKFGQQLSLMLALAGGKRDIGFKVADGGRTKSYRFEYQGKELIHTPAGSYQALNMVRTKDGRPSQASLWLAPEINYLPVRVERKEKDGLFVMKLNAFRWD